MERRALARRTISHLETARTAEVVWYVTGRFYATIPTSNEPSQLLDVGYFLHLQGIAEHLFNGEISEKKAWFTFAAEPFSAPSINNGDLEIGIDLRGRFSVFLRDTPGATFDDPNSFRSGKCIGTFDRVAIVPTVKIGVSSSMTILSNVFTARLVSSIPFQFGGTLYDLRDLIGYGVTQWGTAATEPVLAPIGYAAVVPFVGSAVRVS